MDALAGVSCTRVYQVILNGVPTAGATLTYAFTGPDGATITLLAPGVTDNTDGTYSIELDGTSDIPTAGTYHELWTGSLAGRDLRAEGSVLVGTSDGRAVTRRELRWDVADQLEDLWLGVASAVGATSITVPGLEAPLNDWEGAEIYVYAGTGVGQTRVVTASGDNTGVFTVPAWTTLPTDASVEVHRRFTVARYNRALSRAIRQTRDIWVETEDRSLLQVSGQFEYALPAGLTWLVSVETLDTATTDSWTLLNRISGQWTASNGTLRITGAGLDGVRMRLRGYRAPQGLDYDEQFADLDAGYLTLAAASLLTASEIAAPALDRHAAAGSSTYYQTLAAAKLRRSALQDAIRVAL